MFNLLLIGGSGFVGASLASNLIVTGDYSITVVGRSQEPKFPLPVNVIYKPFDIFSSNLHELLAGFDGVIDLAYATKPSASFDDPIGDILNNIPVHVRLFQAARDVGIGKYIYISSGGTVYGNGASKPFLETNSTDPISPYGITKLSIEKYAQMFFKQNGFPVVIARPSNPFGINQLQVYGQGFIAAAYRALTQGTELTIYGDRGTIRDYIYIDDLVMGIASILKSGKYGEIYNVGSGVGYDNIEILGLMSSCLDMTFPKINRLLKRPFDAEYSVLDISKIKNDTGWAPNFDVKSGMLEMLKGLR
jgi:UDP-glucose 4-epimerase